MTDEADDMFPMDETTYNGLTQGYVDGICHYRNLAIVLGAKPENMRNNYDRWLCEKYDEAEAEDYMQATDVEDWEENERLRSLLNPSCAAFGHLWGEKPIGWRRLFDADRSHRCSSCGMYRFVLASGPDCVTAEAV